MNILVRVTQLVSSWVKVSIQFGLTLKLTFSEIFCCDIRYFLTLNCRIYICHS